MVEYTDQQRTALRGVQECVDRLVEYEELDKKAHQPIYNMDCSREANIADLMMVCSPPYAVLEQRLRDSLDSARKVGLGEHQGIVHLTELSAK